MGWGQGSDIFCDLLGESKVNKQVSRGNIFLDVRREWEKIMMLCVCVCVWGGGGGG